MGANLDLYVLIVALLFLTFTAPPILSANEPQLETTVYPMMDQFYPANSEINVTFNCTVPSNVTIVWSIDNTQIIADFQFDSFMADGYAIEPKSIGSTFSTMTVSVADKNTQIACLPFNGGHCEDCTQTVYSIVPFGLPSLPVNLNLLYVPSLKLVWSRPSEPPYPQVPISYTIEINATEGGGMNFRNFTLDTSLSVQFLENLLSDSESDCVEFQFFVSATNDAGTGPMARIKDTVPISPDVTNISNEARVEQVSLQSQGAAVVISFPPAETCGNRFPLTNYTINLNNKVYDQLHPRNVTSGIQHTVDDLPLDESFSLTITVCNEVTCRTSTPRIINTTDVQTAKVVFYKNDLYLQCTFAANSKAMGCVFELVLENSNKTERFNVKREEGELCMMANNQRDAYGSVLVMDWEENGEDGNVTLDVTSIVLNVSTLAEFTTLTGFRKAGDGMKSQSGDGINLAITVAVPVVLVSAVLITATVLVLILTIVCVKQRRTIKRLPTVTATPPHEDTDSLEVVFKGDEVSNLLKQSKVPKEPANTPENIVKGGDDTTDSPSVKEHGSSTTEITNPTFKRSDSVPQSSTHSTAYPKCRRYKRSFSTPEKSNQASVGTLVISKNSLRVQFIRLREIKKGESYPFLLKFSEDIDCVNLLPGDSEDEKSGESKTFSPTPAAVERGDLPSHEEPSSYQQTDLPTGMYKPTNEHKETKV